MPYAIAPTELTTLLEKAADYTANPNRQQIDGGVEHIGKAGKINLVGSKIPLEMVVHPLTVYTTIFNFLHTLNGKPFRWNGRVYRAEKESWTALGAESWRLNLELIEIFNPDR